MTAHHRALSALLSVAVLGGGALVGPPAGAAPAVVSATAPATVGTLDLGGLLDLGLLEALQPPRLEGVPDVGETLTLLSPVWSLPGVTQTLQWVRNGVPIPGATGSTYVPTADDAGAALQGIVTGTVLGLLPVETVTGVLMVPSLPGGGGGGTGPGPDPLTLLGEPSITGLPGVGSLLVVLEPAWSLPGVTTTYQWLADGAPIDGATGPSFVPTLAEAGSQLAVQVTGVLAGLPVVEDVTAPILVPLLPPETQAQTVAAQGQPALDGPARVGRPLTATGPQWNTDGVTSSYQWFVDGTPVDKATSQSWTPTAAHLGRTVTVAVTGSKSGYTSATATSASEVVGRGAAPTPSSPPSVSGTHSYGAVLDADPGRWSDASTSLQWRRDGADLVGETAPTYVIGSQDVGRTISLVVTAVRPGHEVGTAATAPVTVSRASTVSAVRLKKAKVGKGNRAVAVLTVRADGLQPRGRVKVLDGRRTIATYTVDGAKRVRLPKLKPGRHRLRAVYAGSTLSAPSRSRVVRLTVTRR